MTRRRQPQFKKPYGRNAIDHIVSVLYVAQQRDDARPQNGGVLMTTCFCFARFRFAMICVALLWFRPAAGEPYIVKDGHANAEIVIAAKPARTVRLAAADLQGYIQKITGARLPIVTEPGGKAVKLFVGRSPHTDRLGITADGLKYGAYRLVSGNDWLVFIGDDTDFVPPKIWARRGGDANEKARVQKEWETAAGGPWLAPAIANHIWKERRRVPADVGLPDAAPRPDKKESFEVWTFDERGSYNAVIAFLQELGVRWLLPGELGEIVPQSKTIPLPKIDKIVRPDFEIRAFHNNMGEWTWRLGARNPFLSWTEHGMSLLQRKEIFDAHPDWFALYGGKRSIKHFCYSNEELFRETVRCVRAQFDVYGFEGVSVMPPDGFVAMCQCPLCEGKDDPSRPLRGRHSNYVWGFVNRVAKEIAQTHPGKLIYNIAYNYYRLPPTNIEKLEPNVQVIICNGRMAPQMPADEEAELRALRESWRSKTDRPILMSQNYPWTSRGHYKPCFAARTIGQDINAIKGISRGEEIHLNVLRDTFDASAAFNAFQIYFTARMYWGGKEQSVEALLDEYCRQLYGPAGDAMKAFFCYCETNWPDMEKDKAKIDAALALFDAAKAKVAPSSIEGRRLAPLDQFLNGLRMKSAQLGQKRGVVPKLRLVGEARDIVIDGRLDEPFWQTINPGSTGRLRELQTGRPPALGTKVMAGWYNNNLYLAIRCEEVPGEKPNITTTKHDDHAIFSGDTVEILLETPAHSYYQIAVNPAGAVCDLDRGARGMSDWDSQAEVAARVADDHWTVEIRIPVTPSTEDPLHQVVGRAPSISLPWFVNICRQRVRENGVEHSALSPTGRSGFHHPLSFAHLYAGLSHTFEADLTVTNYVTALRAAEQLPKAERLTALVALADGSRGKWTDLQQSHALKQAAAAARSLKDHARAAELTARIPIEAERKTAQMLNLLAEGNPQEVIARFGNEDLTKWPFWAAGEGYFARGRAYAAVGERARAESDFKAALPLIGDPRLRSELLKALQQPTRKAAVR